MRAFYALALLPVLVLPASAEPLIDLVILADESGSMSPGGFQEEMDFAAQAADGLTFGPTDAAASLLLYGATSRVIIDLTTNKMNFINAVNNAQYAQAPDTDMASGLTLAQSQFTTHGRANAIKILALVGDGMPDLNNSNIVPTLNALAAAGVHVFSIAGGVDPHRAFMESLLRNDGEFLRLEPNPAAAFIDAIEAAAPTGDYNSDGIVNSADYTIWRNTRGSTTDLRANGNDANDLIDMADYEFWKQNFGRTNSTAAAVAIPEPAAIALAALVILFVFPRFHRGVPNPV
ncbi:MAG: vWA domain-containing protein [Pirellulales bacterium]